MTAKKRPSAKKKSPAVKTPVEKADELLEEDENDEPQFDDGLFPRILYRVKSGILEEKRFDSPPSGDWHADKFSAGVPTDPEAKEDFFANMTTLNPNSNENHRKRRGAQI